MREAHVRRLYTVVLDVTLQLYDTLQNPKLQGTEKEEQLIPGAWMQKGGSSRAQETASAV